MNLSRRLWWGLSGSVFVAVLSTSLIAWFAAESLLIGDADDELRERAKHTAQMPWIPMRFMQKRSRQHIGQFFLYLGNPNGTELFKTESWSDEFPKQLPDGVIHPLRTTDARSFRVIQVPVDEKYIKQDDDTATAEETQNTQKADPQEAAIKEKKEDVKETRDNRRDRSRHSEHFRVEAGTVIMMAADITDLDQDLSNLRNLLVGVGISVFCISLFIATRLRDSLLAPVKNLGAAIDTLEHDNIEARIHVAALPSELLQISERLNDLLARLADSRKRERRTIGDIAHELRTPLAALRSELEFAISAGDIPAERSSFLEKQVSALHDRVNGLLLLMRLEGEHQAVEAQPISIAELISDAWSAYATSGHHLQFENDDDFDIHGDPALLAMIADNILGNACAYSPANSDIRVAVEEQETQYLISISNPCSLAAGDYQHAFDPFWRHDISRQQSEDHHGLGLALVQRIAQAHQAQVRAHVNAEQLFTLILQWPRKPSTHA